MSNRAKEAALKACPVVIEEHTESDINKSKRLFYIKGYEQAEKDLTLTGDDMKAVIVIADHIRGSINGPRFDSKEYYEEVLHRFLEYKNKAK